jgi:hypothetical protein
VWSEYRIYIPKTIRPNQAQDSDQASAGLIRPVVELTGSLIRLWVLSDLNAGLIRSEWVLGHRDWNHSGMVMLS